MSDSGTPAARDRLLAAGWEALALALLIASWDLQAFLSSDARTLAWLLVGLHLWRGLTVLGRAPLAPWWLILLESAALLGALDSGPDDSAGRFERLVRWQGLAGAGGSLPLWCFAPGLGVWALCISRLVRWRAAWSESRLDRFRRPTTRLGALSLLAVPAALFLGTTSSSWPSNAPPAGVQAEESLSWQTARSHLRLRGRAQGTWTALELPAPGRALNLRYSSQALVNAEARLLARGERGARVLAIKGLLGTSPGLVRALIEVDPELRLGPQEHLTLEIRCSNDPRFEGVLELAPLEHVQTSFVLRSERDGWLGALATSPLCPLGLGLALLYVLGAWPRLTPGWRWLSVSGLVLGSVGWLVATAPQVRLVLGWVALGPATLLLGLQGWLGLAPLSGAFPPAVRYGSELFGVFEGQLAPVFPTGMLSRGATPAHLERIEAGLSTISGLLPPWVLALGVLALGVALIRSATAGSPQPRWRASTCLFVLSGLCFVVHPSWFLPITPVNQRTLAVLLVGGVLLAWRALRWLEDRVPVSEPSRRRLWVDPPVLLLVALYVLLRAPDLFNPPTLNSDEGFVWSCGVGAYSGFTLGFSRWTVLFVLSGLGTATIVFARRVEHAERWLLGFFGVLLVAWTLWYPAPAWGQGTIFRYPPLTKLVLGGLSLLFGPSLEASRLCSLLGFGVAGYALYLAARRLGYARGASISVLLLFLGANTIWYWSAFTYNSTYLVTCTALSCVPLCGWIRRGDPESLCWLGFSLALTGASRVTGAVAFAVFFLAVCSTLALKPGHRTRGNAWGLAFLVAAVVPGVLLWQKGLAGWYSEVGVAMSWHYMGTLLSTFDRWRLTPTAVLDGNGPWLLLLAGAGVLAGVVTRSRRAKWGGIVCVLALWLAVMTVVPILFGRSWIWDAFGRFLLPTMLPLALLGGLALDAAQRRFGRWAPLVCVAPMLIWHLGVLGRPPKLPSDLNPYVQNYERTHIFVPETQISAGLPDGVALKESVFFHEAFIFSRIGLAQVPVPLPKTLDELHTEMVRGGWRLVVIPYAPDPYLNDVVWRYQRTGAPLDPRLWQEPASISADPRFEPAGVVSFDDVEFRLYLRQER